MSYISLYIIHWLITPVGFDWLKQLLIQFFIPLSGMATLQPLAVSTTSDQILSKWSSPQAYRSDSCTETIRPIAVARSSFSDWSISDKFFVSPEMLWNTARGWWTQFQFAKISHVHLLLCLNVFLQIFVLLHGSLLANDPFLHAKNLQTHRVSLNLWSCLGIPANISF